MSPSKKPLNHSPFLFKKTIIFVDDTGREVLFRKLLLSYLFVFFGNFVDAVLTWIGSSFRGPMQESNPLMREFLLEGSFHWFFWKIVPITLFLILIVFFVERYNYDLKGGNFIIGINFLVGLLLIVSGSTWFWVT